MLGGSAGLSHCTGAGRTPAAGECRGGGQGCLKKPSWAQKRTVSLKKLHIGNLSWPGDVSQSQTCNLGDQILLTLGKHALPALQLVSMGLLQLRAWTSFTIPQSAHALEQKRGRFKKGSSFFSPMLHVKFCVCSIPMQPPTRFCLFLSLKNNQEHFHHKTTGAAAGWFQAGEALQ